MKEKIYEAGRDIERFRVASANKAGFDIVAAEKERLYITLGRKLQEFGDCQVTIVYRQADVDFDGTKWPESAQSMSPVVRMSLRVVIAE